MVVLIASCIVLAFLGFLSAFVEVDVKSFLPDKNKPEELERTYEFNEFCGLDMLYDVDLVDKIGICTDCKTPEVGLKVVTPEVQELCAWCVERIAMEIHWWNWKHPDDLKTVPWYDPGPVSVQPKPEDKPVNVFDWQASDSKRKYQGLATVAIDDAFHNFNFDGPKSESRVVVNKYTIEEVFHNLPRDEQERIMRKVSEMLKVESIGTIMNFRDYYGGNNA